ncbi:helix-turn-helix domain-containing protein [Halocatena marina]|uniref:helix-turn-helix domain-containing protein n=1 Tax=Halocatena marina TaxID=2934937 RepID=UPI002224AD99|nr:helix-turn-helix domain-containing protein [Halocatena marina]
MELERLVLLHDGIIPLFWVEGATLEDLRATVETDPVSEEVHHLTEMDGRHLFEIQWSPDVNALVDPMIESGAEVLPATGTVNVWEFRLQFRNRARLATFRERCQDNEVDMHLNALYNPTVPAEKTDDELTAEQYDIIDTAYRNGYWEIPREITMGELAELIGISSNAASQRLRRGLTVLVGEALTPY